MHTGKGIGERELALDGRLWANICLGNYGIMLRMQSCLCNILWSSLCVQIASWLSDCITTTTLRYRV